ncbi:MAG: carbon-nitrogen hydrolase family protein [Planctomycetota bacterium]
MPKKGVVRVATCQFPVSGDVRRNARWAREQLTEAARRRADIVHFPECALSGYPGTDLPSLDDLDWDLLRDETESIRQLARDKRVWVVLGTSHRLTGDHKPHNSLYVIDRRGRIRDRFDKRMCTGGDLKHFSPGDHFVMFSVNGVKCGLLICYEVRFPELYRACRDLGVKIILQSFHNAHGEKRGIWWTIMRPNMQCRAATNNLFISGNNSSRYYQQWPSVFITPDGMIRDSARMHRSGVLVNTVDLNKEYYHTTPADHDRTVAGVFNTGEPVDDPRSRDRTSL